MGDSITDNHLYVRGYEDGWREAITKAAAHAREWGGHPPSPLGRRAKLAAEIEELKPPQITR